MTTRVSGFRDLLAFMTGIPVGGGSVENAARSFFLIPLVGALEGALVALVLYSLELLGAGALVAGVAYLAAHVVLTGGLHLDGFADYADVLGSRLSGEQAVRVLKDPRRGSYSVVWLGSILIATVALTSVVLSATALKPWLYTPLFVSVYSASAESMYLVVSSGNREPYEGLAAAFKDSVGVETHLMNALVYALTALAPAWLVFEAGGAGMGLAVALVLLLPLPASLVIAKDANSRLGFVNGDVAGFAYESLRVLSLAILALVARPGA